ncbi:hypothetical protein PHJA_000815100 [Phtheirospermum japonicum]|uniref:KANL3/Tex30 alpha/beta hydrolase-like domain-containing protein n=1 Tax=Phtheirospermum japonicum TaxID=374723 RepID=A0A830BRK5_9LAMI|nr:hypothetical protein PHJA_000815100 [Phtheirospermum japonicum]
MASLQCHKPCEQTNHTTTCHQKGTKVDTCHNKHTNEHSFTDKVKEITQKIYHPHGHGHPAPTHTHNCSTTTTTTTTAHTVKPTNNNCFTGAHGKHRMTKKKNKNKSAHNKHDGGCSDSGSSSDESDDDTRKTKPNNSSRISSPSILTKIPAQPSTVNSIAFGLPPVTDYLPSFIWRENQLTVNFSCKMVNKRVSKRRRKNQDVQHEEKEEETHLSPPPGVDENSGNLIENKAKEEKLPVIVLAHGAGAPSSSDWMIRWKCMLAESLNAIEVVSFDYPYIAGGKRRAPPKAEKLVDFHCDIVKKTMAKYPGHPLVLAGKSMGSRVSCMVAEEKDITASAVVCLGYPLKGVKGAVRDETLLKLTVPVMFVQHHLNFHVSFYYSMYKVDYLLFAALIVTLITAASTVTAAAFMLAVTLLLLRVVVEQFRHAMTSMPFCLLHVMLLLVMSSGAGGAIVGVGRSRVSMAVGVVKSFELSPSPCR